MQQFGRRYCVRIGRRLIKWDSLICSATLAGIWWYFSGENKIPPIRMEEKNLEENLEDSRMNFDFDLRFKNLREKKNSPDFVWGHSEKNSDSNFGIFAAKGPRFTMEDRFRILINKRISAFAIFDGHGGELVADYAEDFLLLRLLEVLKNSKSFKNFRFDSEQKIKKLEEKIQDEISSVDQEMRHLAEKKSSLSGSTAVMAILDPKGDLILINIGDSRGIVIDSNWNLLAKTKDHKPNDPQEKSRILAAGGTVSHLGVWRLDGVLATSRALGDYFLKPAAHLICTADFYHLKRREFENGFLILASDGLWDKIQNEEVLKILNEKSNSGKNLQEIAEFLVDLALKRGSLDNVTVLIVKLIS